MKIYSIQKQQKTPTELSETFIIEPLEAGEGITVGNTIRRILLSETYGYSITGVSINEIYTEFDQAKFLREDTLEVLLNLKQVILKPSLKFFRDSKKKEISYKVLTKVKGPVIITAGMLNIPKELQILNPNQYICTIIDNSELNLVLTFKYDKAYKLIDDKKKEAYFEKIFNDDSSTLDIDAFFVPIKKVSYKIRIIRDTQGNLKESLIIEIITNSTITPKRALIQSINSCLKLFYPIFIQSLKLEKFKNILT